ncbi:MAG: hypothetical protein ACRYF6_25345, partial [Janthinobacterium lividum]
MQAVFRSGLCAAMILLGACSPKPETAPKKAAEQGEKTANASGEKAEKAEKGEKAEKSGEAGERGEAAEREAEGKEDFVALSDQQIKAAGIEIMPVRQSFAGA